MVKIFFFSKTQSLDLIAFTDIIWDRQEHSGLQICEITAGLLKSNCIRKGNCSRNCSLVVQQLTFTTKKKSKFQLLANNCTKFIL